MYLRVQTLIKIILSYSNLEEVIRLRDQLNTFLIEDLTGFKVRSKIQHGPECERASIFHAARELKNHKNVNNGLFIDGSVVTDRNDIEKEVLHFFNALFNGHHGPDLVNRGVPFIPDWSHLDELLTGMGRLNDTEKKQLVLDVKKSEMDIVVKACPKMKSPGLDGLTYEFYVKVWDVIGDKFIEILQSQLDRRRLVKSNRLGATKLVPKVEGIPKVDELRPITLLNSD